MYQRFRNLHDPPTDHDPDALAMLRGEARKRVGALLMTIVPRTRMCPECKRFLILDEGVFCCGDTYPRHFPWPVPSPQMKAVLATPKYRHLSRVYNSLFSLVVVCPETKNEGFTYMSGGGAAPVMRVNGQMYARLMRQSENIWLFSDSELSKLCFTLCARDAQR